MPVVPCNPRDIAVCAADRVVCLVSMVWKPQSSGPTTVLVWSMDVTSLPVFTRDGYSQLYLTGECSFVALPLDTECVHSHVVFF